MHAQCSICSIFMTDNQTWLFLQESEKVMQGGLFLNGSFLQVEVTQWVSSKHNMGMAFNRYCICICSYICICICICDQVGLIQRQHRHGFQQQIRYLCSDFDFMMASLWCHHHQPTHQAAVGKNSSLQQPILPGSHLALISQKKWIYIYWQFHCSSMLWFLKKRDF